MLSIFYLLLWQSLLLVLTLLVFNRCRTVRQLILPAIIVIHIFQEWIPQLQTSSWKDSFLVKSTELAVQVGGYGWILFQYFPKSFVSSFKIFFVAVQGILILLFELLPASSIPDLYHIMVWLDSLVMLASTTCLLYLLIKNPLPPAERNSFPPILWVTCGVFFYFITIIFWEISKVFFPESYSLPAMLGWYSMVRIVQHVVLYIFLIVAYVICLTQPRQSI